QAAADLDAALDQAAAQSLDRRAIDLELQLDWIPVDHQRTRRDQDRLAAARELDLDLLGGLLEGPNCVAVGRVASTDPHALARLDLRDRPVDDRPVKVAAAQEIVAVVADHAQEALGGLEQRRIKGPAAEIVDQPRAAIVLRRPAGRERRGDRLLQELDVLEAR